MIRQDDNLFGAAIYAYTRAHALADGVLVDVSNVAREAGFTIPVAVTYTLWHDFIEWTRADTETQTYQDTDGRLWDVLSMLRFAIKKSAETSCVLYKLYIIPRDGKSTKARLTQLKAVISGGDNGEPVITVMLPNED